MRRSVLISAVVGTFGGVHGAPTETIRPIPNKTDISPKPTQASTLHRELRQRALGISTYTDSPEVCGYYSDPFDASIGFGMVCCLIMCH